MESPVTIKFQSSLNVRRAANSSTINTLRHLSAYARPASFTTDPSAKPRWKGQMRLSERRPWVSIT
ncbi:MAG: hypothetical protein QW172_03615 [Candidatus Bathyarchaeia archaeon]